jgi:hypothetical protein
MDKFGVPPMNVCNRPESRHFGDSSVIRDGRTMIAHIRQSKEPESVTPIIRARHMVAETLLPDVPVRPRRRFAVRKFLLCSGWGLLALAAVLAYYFWR